MPCIPLDTATMATMSQALNPADLFTTVAPGPSVFADRRSQIAQSHTALQRLLDEDEEILRTLSDEDLQERFGKLADDFVDLDERVGEMSDLVEESDLNNLLGDLDIFARSYDNARGKLAQDA